MTTIIEWQNTWAELKGSLETHDDYADTVAKFPWLLTMFVHS